MFRIERNLVNLGAVRSVVVDANTGAADDAAQHQSNTAVVNPVVNAQEILSEAMAKAEQIIKDAHIEAADIVVSTKTQSEDERRKAWEEGYTEGAAEGRRSFDEQLSEKITQNDESLKRVIKEIYDERELTYSTLENDVISLTLAIVRKILNPTEEAIGGVFESLVKNALRQIAPDGKIMLRVSPADYERHFSSGNAIIELENGVNVTASVLRDISLDELDCIIDREGTTVNAGLETQLKLIELAFAKGFG